MLSLPIYRECATAGWMRNTAMWILCGPDQNFEIIEITGAGSESIHIWDRDAMSPGSCSGAVAAISYAV